MSKFTDSLIGENLEVATEYFKSYMASANSGKKGKTSGGSIGFIPFNIGFTMDGLSGIKIYNELVFDTSFLPYGYNTTLDFIVTGIDHKLKNGDWETDVKVTLIPKTDELSEIITGSISISAQKESYTPPPVVNNVVNTSTLNTNGPGYDPIKAVIFSDESGNYDSLFPSTTYQAAFGKSSLVTTIAEVVANTKDSYTYKSGKKKDGTPNYATVSTRAVGRYQNLGNLLYKRAQEAGLDPNTALYSIENQEKIGEKLINFSVNDYFTKGGNVNELTRAVQGLSQTWSSMPTIKNNKGVVVGDVVTGNGIKAYYSSGVNAKDKNYSVKTVVEALIKTYKNLNGGKNPSFVPTYI
jgi:hypothetical protein